MRIHQRHRPRLLFTLLTGAALVITTGCGGDGDEADAGPTPDAGPTDAGQIDPDAGPTDPEIIGRLEGAFQTQREAANLLGDPALFANYGSIVGVLQEAAPLMQQTQAELREVREQGTEVSEVNDLLERAERENDAALEIAGYLQENVITDTAVLQAHFDELQARTGLSMQEINQALWRLDAGPIGTEQRRTVDVGTVEGPAGYTTTVFATNLNFPTAVAVTNDRRIFVAESGGYFGGINAPARIVQIIGEGQLEPVSQNFETPILGMTIFENEMFVAHGDTITRINIEDGERTDLIDDLRVGGGAHVNSLVVGPDGRLYFTVGTVTNTGVVDMTAYRTGWLNEDQRDLRDVPCRDLILTGTNVFTGNPFTEDFLDTTTTGVFQPFGTAVEAGQTVEAQDRCTGAIYAMDRDGSNLEIYADGFTNPYGLAFAPDGRLFVSETGPMAAGTRPVNAPGNLYQVQRNAWYGFPDFFGGEAVENLQPQFGWTLERTLQDPPELAPGPIAQFDINANPVGMDVAPEGFGQAFAYVATFGPMARVATSPDQRAGHGVYQVSATGEIERFFVPELGDAQTGFLFRPTDVAFDRTAEAEGRLMFVTHYGDVRNVPGGALPAPGTGALIRIERTGEPQ